MNPPAPNPAAPPLKLFSVIIPARDEEGALPATLEHLHLEFSLNNVRHEAVDIRDNNQVNAAYERAQSNRPADVYANLD